MGSRTWLVTVGTWILLALQPSCVHGVRCWAERDDATATCSSQLALNVTVGECCKNYGEDTFWSSGVPSVGDSDCHPCGNNETCGQTTCPEGQKCVIKSGGPSCEPVVTCWGSREELSLTCGFLVNSSTTKDECCSLPGDQVIYWSPRANISPGRMFWLEMMHGGVPDCFLCERTCEQMACPQGRKCVMKSGRPRCVCKPDCTQENTSHRGPVCATNGRQYKSMCALLKMKCRQEDQYYELEVAYYGPCQNSCDSVQCIGSKCCEVDQHGRPHCVSYDAVSCPGPFRDEFVCGSDGVTYESLCQLRRTSCSRGNIIPVAYEGKCNGLASCNDTVCVKRKQCLWDSPANTSRCILCNYTCSGWASEEAVCASDGQAYRSWCEMQEHICRTGEYVELVSWGSCNPDGTSDLSDLGSGEDRAHDQIYFTPSSRQVLSELRSSMYRNQGRDSGNATVTEAAPTLMPQPESATPYGHNDPPVTNVADFLQALANKGAAPNPNDSDREDY